MEPTNNQPSQRSSNSRPARPTPRPAQPAAASPQVRETDRPAAGNPGAPRRTAGGNNSNGSGGGKGRRRANQANPIAAKLMNPLGIPVNKSSFNGTGGEQATQVKGRVANQASPSQIRIIPLGGLGEVGKNMMAIEYENDMILVDMGFAFPDEHQPGIDYIIPDTSYVEKNAHKLRGIIITHGHMDHIGAAGYVLPKFHVPVFGTKLSLAMVEKQIEEFKLASTPDFRVMDPDAHERVQLGVFNVELTRVTHSIPDAAAAIIRTPIGTLVHTGDWRLDPDPIDGRKMDLDRLGEVGKEGVLLLMSDSTNTERVGRTPSEKVIEPTLDDLFGRASGRIIISTFASSLTRVQLIINATAKANRKLAFIGRSMLANVELAVKLGYIKVPPGLIARVQDGTKGADDRLVILCTGSQGEANSALSRMATGDHPHVKIKPGDTIMLSSNPIPGNEKSVVASVDSLLREGARVYLNTLRELDSFGLLHVSGHASNDDLAELINLIKPKYFMPIHGEFHMLVRHAELAVKNGVTAANSYVMDNGDVLEINASGAKKGERVSGGIILIDGSGVGDVENLVLRDRLALGSDGMVVIIATVDKRSGRLLTSPDIISRGFVHMKESEELIGRVRQEIRKSFERRDKQRTGDWARFKMNLRDDVADFLYARTKRNPMVLPVINEIDGK